MGLGEFELIRRYFTRHSKRPDVVVGVGDDAAVLSVAPGEQLVAAVDTLVEGRHFLANAPAASVGHRALAVNLSDLAAMGARPAWATMALTLPRTDPVWLGEFSAGFFRLADEFGVALVGGDITAGPCAISVQILGTLPQGSALLRSGAKPGDLLAVTGTLGDAAAGLEILLAAALPTSAQAALLARHEYPNARIEFGCEARDIASAAMDVSDGLAGDLAKLAAASGVAAAVAVDGLPLSDALLHYAGEDRARDFALGGGDDYELLLCVAPDRWPNLEALAQRHALRLTAIGHIASGGGVTWSMKGRPFSPAFGGYEHFSADSESALKRP